MKKTIHFSNETWNELVRTLRGQIVDNVTNEIIETGKPLVSEETIKMLIKDLSKHYDMT